MLRDSHQVEIEFDGDWSACVWPTAGREMFFNVDFDEDGRFTFTVAHSSGWYGDRHYIESWVTHSCDRFLFNGVMYQSIEEVSLEMWLYELKIAANDDRAVEDVLECVGMFTNPIQEELFRCA